MACMLAESYESAKKSEYNTVQSSVHGILQTDMQTVSQTINEALPHKTYKYGADARPFYVEGCVIALSLSVGWYLLLADACFLCSNGLRSPRQKLLTTTSTQHKADSESVAIQDVLDIFWPSHVRHGGDGDTRCLLHMQDDNGDFTAEGCIRQDDHLPVGNWVSLAVVLSWSGGSDRKHFLTIKPINIGIWWWCCCCCYCCKMVLLPTAAAAAARWCCCKLLCKLLLQAAGVGSWWWCKLLLLLPVPHRAWLLADGQLTICMHDPNQHSGKMIPLDGNINVDEELYFVLSFDVQADLMDAEFFVASTAQDVAKCSAGEQLENECSMTAAFMAVAGLEGLLKALAFSGCLSAPTNRNQMAMVLAQNILASTCMQGGVFLLHLSILLHG